MWTTLHLSINLQISGQPRKMFILQIYNAFFMDGTTYSRKKQVQNDIHLKHTNEVYRASTF